MKIIQVLAKSINKQISFVDETKAWINICSASFNNLEKRIIEKGETLQNSSTMKLDALAPKWIFYYFQLFGLHSFDENRSFSVSYQILLSILLAINYGVALYNEILGNGVEVTTAVVDTVDGNNDFILKPKT